MEPNEIIKEKDRQIDILKNQLIEKENINRNTIRRALDLEESNVILMNVFEKAEKFCKVPIVNNRADLNYAVAIAIKKLRETEKK